MCLKLEILELTNFCFLLTANRPIHDCTKNTQQMVKL